MHKEKKKNEFGPRSLADHWKKVKNIWSNFHGDFARHWGGCGRQAMCLWKENRRDIPISFHVLCVCVPLLIRASRGALSCVLYARYCVANWWCQVCNLRSELAPTACVGCFEFVSLDFCFFHFSFFRFFSFWFLLLVHVAAKGDSTSHSYHVLLHRFPSTDVVFVGACMYKRLTPLRRTKHLLFFVTFRFVYSTLSITL